MNRSHWLLVSIVALLCPALAEVAQAEPTPTHRRVVWTHSGVGPDGFYLYWAPQEENPRVYSNVRRFKIAGAAVREAVVIDLKPDAAGLICFKVTAYRAASVAGDPDIESGYSAETNPCGNFGMEAPAGAAIPIEPSP